MTDNRNSPADAPPTDASLPGRSARLKEVALLFLTLGTISFGGPAAHIALMERECTRRRAWLTREHFLSLLAAVNLVPGPNATEMAIHIGYVRAGWAGLVAGGVCFILPAFFLSLLLGIIYVRAGTLPQTAAVFYGINPVVVAIILSATYRLGRTAIKDWRAVAIFALCAVAALFRVNEVILLLAAGVGSLLVYGVPWQGVVSVSPFLLLGLGPLLSLAGDTLDRLLAIGLFFLKVGSLMFGSGMVLFAFVQKDIVTNLGWLTQQQLLDAIAVGQMTPGPVLSAVTFIGYVLAGWQGATVATVAVFLPSFVIVALTGPWIPRLRQSAIARSILTGVNAAVVALMAVTGLILFRSAIVDVGTMALFVLSLVAVFRYNVDSMWLIVTGGILGFLSPLA